MGYQLPQKRRIATARIVGIYTLLGLAWIYGSNTVLGWLVSDPAVMVKIAVIKGSLFILFTATLLFFLINRLVMQILAAESRQIESLKNYEAIFNATNESIFVHDAQSGRILDVNDRMLKTFGYERDETLKIDIGNVSVGTPPYSQEEAVEKVRKAMLEGPQVFEWLCRKKTGELFWTEVSLSKYSTHEFDRILAVVRDISERKQAEQTLRDSEELYRKLFEVETDAILLLDQETHRFLDANLAAQGIYGYSLEEFIQLTAKDITAEPEKTRQAITSKHYRLSERLHRKKDGTIFPVEISGSSFSYHGRDVHVAAVRDITERKRAKEEKTKLEAQLQQAQKMESVGRLAGGVAHDFNNLLVVILGFAEMAIMKLDPAHPLHVNLMQIRKAAERAADLTRQLLAFARKQTIVPKVLDMNETVAGMINMLQRLIGEDIHLTWHPAGGLWNVYADPSQIDQILANLCVNARDAIADVGEIAIETGNTTFDEDQSSHYDGFMPGEYVRLAVSDNGCGMDKETLSQIFEPFFTTKVMGKGTGLGLSTVYGTVKQNGGFIDVQSNPEIGTTFTIYLPRHVDKAEQARMEGMVRPTLSGQETILLVEDELAVLELTTMMLNTLGYTVLAANTPSEAISMARENLSEIHLLITDVIMSEMNGRDLNKTLHSFYPHLKCLFMSGYTADIIAHHGVLDESVNFIQKPFSLNDLAGKVREMLDSK